MRLITWLKFKTQPEDVLVAVAQKLELQLLAGYYSCQPYYYLRLFWLTQCASFDLKFWKVVKGLKFNLLASNFEVPSFPMN